MSVILSYEIKDFNLALNACETLADIFELVKQSVKRFLNKHRAGLMLGLTNLGMRRGYFIGAFHPIGSNIIVMNKAPIEIALKSTGKQVFNAYCFHLLLHEYLHSLGYIDEGNVRELTREVCRLSLGNDNPATVMAERGIGAYFPKVTYFAHESLPRDLRIEILRDFDRSSVGYIH